MITKSSKVIYIASCDICGNNMEESDEEGSFRQGIVEHDTHLCDKHDDLQPVFDYLDINELTDVKKRIIELEKKKNAKSKS